MSFFSLFFRCLSSSRCCSVCSAGFANSLSYALSYNSNSLGWLLCCISASLGMQYPAFIIPLLNLCTLLKLCTLLHFSFSSSLIFPCYPICKSGSTYEHSLLLFHSFPLCIFSPYSFFLSIFSFLSPSLKDLFLLKSCASPLSKDASKNASRFKITAEPWKFGPRHDIQILRHFYDYGIKSQIEYRSTMHANLGKQSIYSGRIIDTIRQFLNMKNSQA